MIILLKDNFKNLFLFFFTKGFAFYVSWIFTQRKEEMTLTFIECYIWDTAQVDLIHTIYHNLIEN